MSVKYKYASVSPGLSSPIQEHEDVDISSTDHSFEVPTRAIYIGGTGSLTVTLAGSDNVPVTHNFIGSGTIFPLRVAKVMKTGTTASNIIGYW